MKRGKNTYETPKMSFTERLVENVNKSKEHKNKFYTQKAQQKSLTFAAQMMSSVPLCKRHPSLYGQ